MQTAKVYTKADSGKLSKIVQFNENSRVEIPINKDGSIKFYEDKPKKEGVNHGR